jgi:hypothetical protein
VSHSLGNKLLILACWLGPWALLGCADDPVTTPGGQPLVFQGRLEQGQRIEAPLLLEEEGTIRIVATDLTPILIQAPVPELSIGLGIGDLVGGACNLTFGTSLTEGDNLTVLVEDAMQCLLFFDNGSLPPDAIISYTVTVEDLKSD